MGSTFKEVRFNPQTKEATVSDTPSPAFSYDLGALTIPQTEAPKARARVDSHPRAEVSMGGDGNMHYRTLGPMFADTSPVSVPAGQLQFNTQQGLPAREITPQTLVTIPGTNMQTTVENAQRLGLIPNVIPSQANVVNPSQMPQTVQQTPLEDQANPVESSGGFASSTSNEATEFLPQETLQAVNEIYSQQGEDFGDALVNAVISDIGSESTATLDRVARERGLDPSVARQEIQSIAKGFEAAGEKLLTAA